MGNSCCAACGLLSLILSLPTGAAWAEARISPGQLSAYAETSIQLFDPYSAGVNEQFRQFLLRTPMTNTRPVPARMVARSLAVLSLYGPGRAAADPVYFVAANFDHFATSLLKETEAATIREIYGEDIYPQTTCPVFASHGGQGPAELLARATGLPADLFATVKVDRDRLHALFVLTEASHCGFLARTPDPETFQGALQSRDELRALLEAVGDFEASTVFRRQVTAGDEIDEADVLFAARVLATFLQNRVNAYTTIPALTLAFEESGIWQGGARYADIKSSTERARQLFQRIAGKPRSGRLLQSDASLRTLAHQIDAALASGIEDAGEADLSLLRLFPVAVRVLEGDGHESLPGFDSLALHTLPGAGQSIASLH